MTDNELKSKDLIKVKKYNKIQIGDRFGKLTIVDKGQQRILPSGRKASTWICKCDCGNITTVTSGALTSGNTSSCGCGMRDPANKFRKHGMGRTELYNHWRAMKERCYYSKHVRFAQYGGRGITVCEEWRNPDTGFITFAEWAITHGYKEGCRLTLDRINVNDNYYPENCRWTNHTRQANNKSTTHYLTIDGVTWSIGDWSRITGVPVNTIYSRINRLGYTHKEAIFGKPESKFNTMVNALYIIDKFGNPIPFD